MNPIIPRRYLLHTLTSLAIALSVAAASAAPPVQNFCFLHTSDNHLSPQPVGAAALKPGDRTYDGLAWFCAEAVKPQVIEPLNVITPPPAFVINTGDLTEYGVIHQTWPAFEKLIEPLNVPMYVTPGNHDNVWTGMMHVMRQRHGGDHYSFDQFGCHFIGINTATPQEPLPSLEKRTLEWLAADLDKVARGTPVFIFCHHPLSTTEFAKPYEQLRFLRLIERHNVVLLMMGHGHGNRHERWNTLDSIMGGTTSHPVERIGYNIILVQDGMLRVAYRYRDSSKPMEITFEKPLRPQPAPEVSFQSPAPATVNGSPAALSRGELPIRVQLRGGRPTKVTASLNADNENGSVLTAKRAGTYEGKLSLENLTPGLHFVMVTAEFGKQKIDRTEEILVAPAGSPQAGRVVLNAGMKAQPLPTASGLIVATTSGELARISFDDPDRPKVSTLFDAGVEILHAPALVDDHLYFSAAEKGVHCLSLDGRLVWACDVGTVVYGTPAVEAGRVFVGDMEGAVHAIDRKTGKLAWSQRHATYSIEMPTVLHNGIILVGAWDNQLYAIDAKDGSLKWKATGPAGHSSDPKFKARYFAPADCAPVVIGERVFVTDRAYQLGSYNLRTGAYLGDIAANVAAIGPTADGKGFLARGVSKGLTRYDDQGKPVWSQAELPLGRFPVNPVESDGKVFVCSNRGTLTVHDATDGKTLLSYQATPQLHVMAAVGADAAGTAYVAGMDGSVTRVATAR